MKGKIVTVQFPFGEKDFSKLRPAYCLTNPVGKFKHLLLAFITSQPKEKLDSDLFLDSNLSETTGLRRDSTIRFHKVFSVPMSQLKKEIGILKPDLQKVAIEKFLKIIHQ